MKKANKKETKPLMMMENYCDDCDEVLNAVVNEDDFWKFKVGRTMCKCGCVVLPCNECFGSEYHDMCGDCPWKKAKITDAMTDKEVMLWYRENEPKTYNLFKTGKMGDYYNEVIKEIESGNLNGKHKGAK